MEGQCGFGGLSSEQEAHLSSLLADKGVPADQLQPRVLAAVKKVGSGPIAQALQAHNPWQALKSVASKPTQLFKWVQAEELAALIELKAADKHGVAVSKAKQKKGKPASRPAASPLQVDLARLQMAPGSFIASTGTPLAQLGFSEVISQAQGVAFCTPLQMAPFLHPYQALSVDCLGLISTSEISPEASMGAPVSSIRFPAIYGPTQEAIVLTGSLLQLGDESVQLCSSSIAEVETLDTCTVKLVLYKDESPVAWQDLIQAPVRAMLQTYPGLVLCKDPNCGQGDCPKFHAAVGESVDRMLDVWNRQFGKLEGGKVPAKASTFHFFARVPSSATSTGPRPVLRASGAGGIGPHEGYAVIWLPAAPLSAAQHALKTCSKAIGLARHGKKYGVRVRGPDEQEVFQILRPGVDFVKACITQRFRLFPLPHGFQRKNVLQLLRSWKWVAKPLQPAKGDSTGSAWDVGSDTSPPAPALPLGESFVLVNALKPPAHSHKPVSVLASSRTKRRIIYDDEDPDPAQEQDPWNGGLDPWAQALPPPGLAPPASSSNSVAVASAAKYDQIRAELSQDVQTLVAEQVRSNAPDSSAQESRLQKLETGCQELQMQTSKFEGWFSAFGKQSLGDQPPGQGSFQSGVGTTRRYRSASWRSFQAGRSGSDGGSSLGWGPSSRSCNTAFRATLLSSGAGPGFVDLN